MADDTAALAPSAPDAGDAFKPEPAQTGGRDDADTQRQIDALLRERDGYVLRGLGDRVKQVEAEIEKLGVERVERATAEPKAERATKKRG